MQDPGSLGPPGAALALVEEIARKTPGRQGGETGGGHHRGFLGLRVLTTVEVGETAGLQQIIEKRGVEVGIAEGFHPHQGAEEGESRGHAADLELRESSVEPFHRRRAVARQSMCL